MLDRLPVTVLSGFLGSGKTSLLKHLLTRSHGKRIAVIVNDMSEINIDARDVVRNNGPDGALIRREEELVEMTNGCICCTLREDLLEEIIGLASQKRFDYLLIESTGISEPMPVAETFTFRDEDGISLSDIARLDTMATVVDAQRFFEDFVSSDDLQDRGWAADSTDERTIVDLLIDQVEFADVIVINKVDLVDEDSLGRIESFLRRLNPTARILRTRFAEVSPENIMGTGLFNFRNAEKHEGWLSIPRDTERSEAGEYGVSSFVYERRRQFHPERLWRWINEPPDCLLRVKGFLWLATRPDDVLHYSMAGSNGRVEFAGHWLAALPKDEWPDDEVECQRALADWDPEIGDRKQELVLIGVDMDPKEMARTLDSCLLTDSEMEFGPLFWAGANDPFENVLTESSESVDDIPGNL
jgi:G3E family GTPase